MKCHATKRQWYACLLLCATMFSSLVAAQEKRAIKGELATCQINLASSSKESPGLINKNPRQLKYHTPTLNQLGQFDKISNIQPFQKVNVQVIYPQSKAGQKAWVIVLDGGTLENNRKEAIVQLDDQKRLVFNFQAGKSPGIYRIILRKGSDTKMIQLWVGPETLPVKK